MNASNMHTSKLDLYTAVLDTVFKLDWQKSKDKEYMVFKTISMFWTAVHFFFTCHAWLELWTVNSYSSLQRNKKLLRVSGKFELSRVRVGWIWPAVNAVQWRHYSLSFALIYAKSKTRLSSGKPRNIVWKCLHDTELLYFFRS